MRRQSQDFTSEPDSNFDGKTTSLTSPKGTLSLDLHRRGGATVTDAVWT